MDMKKTAQSLPNFDKATIDTRKLSEYSLNPAHPSGGNKARRFKAALGFGPEHVNQVKSLVMSKLPEGAAVMGLLDKHGQRYSVDMELTGPAGKAIVRTAWITDEEGIPPRLVSIYVKES